MGVVGTAKDLLSLVRFQPSLLKHENSQPTYKRMETRSQMNTGSAIETERLFLLPSRTDRDSEAFLQMLRDDGDFSIFCGVSPSEKHVRRFANYFERTDHELCTYSIFLKQHKDKFIGYVGVHREMEDEYEIEFYIASEYRRNGYCEEASRELINQLFGDGVSANGRNLFVDKLYVTTQTENEPTISLLRKLGFREVEDGPIMVVLGNIFEKEDNFFAHEVVKLVLTKEEFSDGN